MSIRRGYTDDKGRAMVKLFCANYVSAEEWDRILKIAKKQGWTQADCERYIITTGMETLGTSFVSCGEKYDDNGNQIEENQA